MLSRWSKQHVRFFMENVVGCSVFFSPPVIVLSLKLKQEGGGLSFLHMMWTNGYWISPKKGFLFQDWHRNLRNSSPILNAEVRGYYFSPAGWELKFFCSTKRPEHHLKHQFPPRLTNPRRSTVTVPYWMWRHDVPLILVDPQGSLRSAKVWEGERGGGLTRMTVWSKRKMSNEEKFVPTPYRIGGAITSSKDWPTRHRVCVRVPREFSKTEIVDLAAK